MDNLGRALYARPKEQVRKGGYPRLTHENLHSTLRSDRHAKQFAILSVEANVLGPMDHAVLRIAGIRHLLARRLVCTNTLFFIYFSASVPEHQLFSYVARQRVAFRVEECN